ncbi:MAG: hypothetical protein U5K75_06315 [Ahrensia sp.]|nr:hypothetical protein [Ahrensia sp.]
MLHTFLKTSASTAVLLALTSSAFAFESSAVFERLKAQIALQGLTLSAKNVVEENNGVTLEGVKFSPEGVDGFTIDKIMLEDITDAQNDGFKIGRIVIPGFATETDGVKLDFGGAQMLGYFIAGPNETDPMLKGNLYEQFSTGALDITVGGKKAFSFGSSLTSVTPYTAGGTLEYDMSINDVTADFSVSPDPKTREVMEQLGYTTLKGEMTAKGSWNTQSGLLTMKPMKIATVDAADLSIELELGGYTPALIDGLQKMQETMKGNEQAMGMAMLGLAQQLDIRQLAIMIDDNSLTVRLLEFFGGQQGMDAAGAAAFAKGMLPLGLAQLGNPAFAQSTAAAVSAFLDDPKNLRIEAAPAAPVPFASLMAGAMGDPRTLIDILAVKVTANQ